MKVSTNKFVTVAYDLHVGEGEERELMERATSDNPLEFIYDTGSMLPAFESQLSNLTAGDAFDFILQPEEAYGEYVDEHVIDLDRAMFEQDGVLNEEVVFAGNSLPMMDSDGNRLNGTVVEVKDDVITMDFNHPLAGNALNFTGTILEVREATPEELTALFAPQSGGCGCGSCSCGSAEEEDASCGSGGCGSGSGSCGCGC